MRSIKVAVMLSLAFGTQSADGTTLARMDPWWIGAYFGPTGAIVVAVVKTPASGAGDTVLIDVERNLAGNVGERIEVTPPAGWSARSGERHIFLLNAYKMLP